MFREEYLTYEGADSLFRNWRPESDILYELLFGALVTVFVYQLTKVILEIGLGQKQRGEMLAHDLYIYMIVSGLSISSVISSFRSKSSHSEEEETEKDESPFSASRRGKSGGGIWVLGKYLVLLLFVPSIHIGGIFLSMEKETDLRFRDLNFGGLSLGLPENTSVIRMKRSSNGCQQVETQLGQGETERTTFFRCETKTDAFFPFDNEDNIDSGNFIVILRASTVDIGVTIVTPRKRWISSLHLDMHDGKQPYLLKNELTPEQRSQIFESGVQKMVAPCESPVQTRGINITWVIPPPQENEPKQDILSVLVECAEFDESLLVEIAEDMLSNVTFVESEVFDVSVDSFSDEFTSGDDVIFVQRRGSSVSLLVMVLMILGVVAVRVVLMFVLNNEGSFALDVILKDHFGLNCCDSMLQYEQPIYYGRRTKQDRVVVKTTSSGMHSHESYELESASWTSDPDGIA